MNLNNSTQEELFQYAYNLISESKSGIDKQNAQEKYDEGMMIMNKLSMECFPNAQIYIGDFLYHVMKNPNQAFDFYNAAAQNGSIKGKYMVSIFLNKGLAGMQDQEKSFNIMYSLAQENIDFAQLDLALFYLNGQGCEKSLEQAFKYFKLAAEQGNPVAQNDLGLCYLEGEGCCKDYLKAFYWFNQSAKNNNSEGYYNLAYMFLHGLGVKKNLNNSLDCFVKSARMGSDAAIYFLEKNNIDITQYKQELDINYVIELENNESATPSFKLLSPYFSTKIDTFELTNLNETYDNFTNPLAFCLNNENFILSNEQWDYLFKNSDLNWKTVFTKNNVNNTCTLFNFAVTSKNLSLFIGKEYFDLLINNSDLKHIDEQGYSNLTNLLVTLPLDNLSYEINIEQLEYMIRNSNLKSTTQTGFTPLLFILSKFDSTPLYSQIDDDLWSYLFENSNLKHIVQFNDKSYSVLDYIKSINNEEWNKYLLSVYQEIISRKYVDSSNDYLH